MFKTILLIFLALFFFTSGINHFLNPRILEEYMERRNFNNPKPLLFLSGLLLITCGPLLLIPHFNLRIYASYALAGFVLIAAVLIHSFWKDQDKHRRMLEAQNFIKNIVICFEMLYLSSTF